MSSAEATPVAQDRHSVMLAELAGLSLELARDLQQRALAAETTEEATRLAAAFHQVSRGLRQTLALELKLIRYKDEAARDAGRAAAEAARDQALAAQVRADAVELKREHVRIRVNDAFWSEHEDPDWRTTEDGRELPLRPPADDPLWARLEAFLDEAEDDADFLTRDRDGLVVAACDALGIDPTLLYEIEGREPAQPETADSS